MSQDRPLPEPPATDDSLQTHFASPQRKSGAALDAEVSATANSPLIDTLLNTVGGLLAVLNEDRQILAVNAGLLAALGVPDAGALLGLRPGEALRCDNAGEMAAGCGTSRHCAHCGAAIAIVSALADGRGEERLCDLTVEREGRATELCLKVRAAPVTLEGRRLVLLFLQDVTGDQRRAMLERVFFHDLNNLAGALAGGLMLLDPADPEGMAELVRMLEEMARRLGKEIALQRTLAEAENGASGPLLREVDLIELAGDAASRARMHPKSEGRRLRVELPEGNLPVEAEPIVLARVLDNMLLNAFEASEPGAEVRLWIEEAAENEAVVQVHNAGEVPQKVAARMFQRRNSTRPGVGRGYGTYAMRLFAERILRGRVSFESAPESGTVFRLHLPRLRA